jgi:NTE family protein
VSPLLDRFRRQHRGDAVAFVLSGGGNLGALQVGMLRALLERRIVPELILGCSVGAINGAAAAEDPSLGMVGRLQDLWRDLDYRDVLPNSGLLPTAVMMARRGVSVHGNSGLRTIIEGMVSARTFAELAVPYQCVATTVPEGAEVWFSSGSLVEPILASAALPAVLPPVEIDGVRHIDGAVVNDIPIARAVELGATTIFVLHTGSFDRPRPEPRRPIEAALQAYWIARRARFRRELEIVPADVDLILMPTGPLPPIRHDDLRHSEDLIAAAYVASLAFLDRREQEPALVRTPAVSGPDAS